MAVRKPFPSPVSLGLLLGPSFIILALGLGSGEVILWPFLTSKYGLGIAWGALLGLTFQYFMNMEIERYSLLKGQSVFVGLYKRHKWVPYWFILSTFLGFGIPGIIAASAKVASYLLGFETHKWVAIFFLISIGGILSSGRTVYSMMERITKIVLITGVPLILILAIRVSDASDWVALGRGFVGMGEGYWFIPAGISFAIFLAAFAYAGAGGNLNLTQSIYVKEKGYGMGKYAGKMASLFRSKKEAQIKLEGTECDYSKESLKNFRQWWKKVSLEHFIVFWLIGIVTISLLMLLSYSTAYGLIDAKAADISFVITEGKNLGLVFLPIIGVLFLIGVVIMLFQTQLGVMDSTSRIMAENFALKKLKNQKNKKINLSKIYYSFVWAQIIFGIILFLNDFTQPLALIVTGAVVNAVAMFVHVGLVNWMNFKELPKEVQAPIWRKAIICLIFIFMGLFSIYTIYTELIKVFPPS